MTDSNTTKSSAESARGRLFYLDLSGGRVCSMRRDGSDEKVIATACHLPDGIALDVDAGHIYWTNMGVPNLDDGTIERVDFDGKNRKVIIPAGTTRTPKQLHLDLGDRKLYWCDREGMRVMRANLDGSTVETLVQTGETEVDSRDQTRWCVGLSLDHARGHIYWTQKGPDNAELGRIFRAGIEIPKGQRPDRRHDIEVWLEHLPEPIDIEFDAGSRVLYWTDRGDPPRGNTVNRASVDAPPSLRAPEIVLSHLMEGIGIALDLAGDTMFITDLGGTIYSSRLNGSQKSVLQYAQGNLSGIAYADLPSEEK